MKTKRKLVAILSIPLLTVFVALMATGCGGEGGASRVSVAEPARMPEVSEPAPMPEQPHISHNLPGPVWNVLGLGIITHIGTSGGAPAENLRSTGFANGVRLYEGRVVDGNSAVDVVDYLREMTTDAGYLATFQNPPTVSIVEGTSDEYTADTLHAVRIVNSVLPYDKQIAFLESYAPGQQADAPSYGNIHVEFLPQYRWPAVAYSEPSTLGIARWWTTRDRKTAHSSHILIDTGEDHDNFTAVIVHELLHALGFYSHTDVTRFPLSIMNPQINALIPLLGTFLLREIDKDAIRATYARFEPGTPASEITAENLGPWESVSFHLRGEFDIAGETVAFGVSMRNGMAQPWATGPGPAGNLSDNRLLPETATWVGTLLGFTPSGRKINGDARLDVELADLSSGDLLFSGLEYDNTQTWGDGDLEYTVHIQDNGFHNWGHESKDAGDVTGAFFGRNHEGMGGVLRRRNLTGAFGGKR